MNITILSLGRILDRGFPTDSVFLLLLVLFSAGPARPSIAGQTGEDDFARSRREMVEKDLRGRGIKDRKVLAAMALVPRHLFITERQRPLAYEDRPLPIGEDQTISQPYIVALMTELLELKGGERVLEVGTGSGYQAAVLSHVAKEVYTIEIIPSLAEKAKETLIRLGYVNVWVRTGDGFFGWEEKAPFEAILVTASAEKIPEPLWRQLREEGRLVMPLSGEGKRQKLVRVRKIGGRQHVEDITGVIFVPMTGAVQSGAR
ncbi:MAG: protein-L-isoaspartate(D-aspartate) O-methyltransferase [Candidatus Binatia bacterium]